MPDSEEFNTWIEDQLAATSGFTAVVMLLALSEHCIEPISGSYLDIVDDETGWEEMKAMLDGSGHAWDAVVIFAERAPGGGPLVDVVARARLQDRIDDVMANGLTLNDGGMFDTSGRAIRIDPVEVN